MQNTQGFSIEDIAQRIGQNDLRAMTVERELLRQIEELHAETKRLADENAQLLLQIQEKEQ